jgi:hypothetical protein
VRALHTSNLDGISIALLNYRYPAKSLKKLLIGGGFLEDPPMPTAKAYSAVSATSPLASTSIPRRDLTDHDGRIEIL